MIYFTILAQILVINKDGVRVTSGSCVRYWYKFLFICGRLQKKVWRLWIYLQEGCLQVPNIWDTIYGETGTELRRVNASVITSRQLRMETRTQQWRCRIYN